MSAGDHPPASDTRSKGVLLTSLLGGWVELAFVPFCRLFDNKMM
jgi:hypothetical protein